MEQISYRFLNLSDPITPGMTERFNLLVHQLSTNAESVKASYIRGIAVAHHLLFAEMIKSRLEIVGMGMLVEIKGVTGAFGHIEDVVVLDSYRSRGIGKGIVVSLIEKAAGLGFKHLDLTSKPARVPANELYKSLGFVIRETNPYRLSYEQMKEIASGRGAGN